jgi:defect-in-organelle-trafficking protein DotC
MTRIKKSLIAACFSFATMLVPAAFAQSTTDPAPTTISPTDASIAQKQIDRNSFLQGIQAALQLQQPVGDAGAPVSQEDQAAKDAALGSASDPNSPRYKANKLADEAQREREGSAAMNKGAADDTGLEKEAPPPEIEALQQVNKYNADAAHSIADDPVNKEIALDMRKAAQREAALSYGARGGLAKRNFQIMERMRGFDVVLDRVFDFRSLLVKTASGLLIEPPIVKESVDALVIADGGDEAAVADKVFDINKKAKIVSAPRDWRQYLVQTWSEVPPPPHVLWPKTPQEQADWSTWVSKGWDAGVEQAEQIFESNVNQLVADYNGMVRYRMLLAQGMISAPYAMHEDRGVTKDKNQMRVGDRAVRITGPSQFLTGAELWKPADR